MSDTWEINDHGEVVPYTSGRMNHDTSHWRDATPLELEQKSRIQELESELAEARKLGDVYREDARLEEQRWLKERKAHAETKRELAEVREDVKHAREWIDNCDAGDPYREAREAKAGIERLERELAEARGVAKQLAEALGADEVEWADHSYTEAISRCPWCGESSRDGHADDCVRQSALKKAEEAGI